MARDLYENSKYCRCALAIDPDKTDALFALSDLAIPRPASVPSVERQYELAALTDKRPLTGVSILADFGHSFTELLGLDRQTANQTEED